MIIRNHKPFVVTSKLPGKTPSRPDPVDCETAFGIGEYAIAWQLCQASADRGSAMAQVNMGLMLRNGYGVAKDLEAAATWYRKAADQGLARAQWLLGRMYENGEGVPQDIAKAAKWHSLSADQGSRSEQTTLGFFYMDAPEFPQHEALSAKWYLRAAEQGGGFAQYTLGFMYSEGFGVSPDLVQAHKWWSVARANDDNTPEVQEDCAENLDLLAAKMTPEQLVEAQRLAREWRVKPEGPIP